MRRDHDKVLEALPSPTSSVASRLGLPIAATAVGLLCALVACSEGEGATSGVGGAAGSTSGIGGSAGATPELLINRAEYAERLRGFWLGECIANWTGLQTEGDRTGLPYYTDDDWANFDFVLHQDPWDADDDTDIEYVYQHLLYTHQTSMLTPTQIRDGWLNHIGPGWIWVSNALAYELMVGGMLPPETGEPQNNNLYDQIDAQLTTEIFGLFAPARGDVALRMADLPIRTVAYREAEQVSKFYVLMHSLASYVDPDLPVKDQIFWLAEQARSWVPGDSWVADMYDWVKGEYDANLDKDDWESTRDALHFRYAASNTAGYVHKGWFDSGINFGASLVSLFYGEGDYQRTVRIGMLAGWDSDNPTATWGGLIGFLIGHQGLVDTFNRDFSDTYNIYRTRHDLPDYLPGAAGEDTFTMMAARGLEIIDRSVVEEMGGRIDQATDSWVIPNPGANVTPGSGETPGVEGSGGTGGTGPQECLPGAQGALPLTVSDVFASSGWMGDNDQLDLPDVACPDRSVGAAGSCYVIDYDFDEATANESWAGIVWQYPANNWDTLPGLCVAEGATNINFCARGELGGEVVSFGGGFAAGIESVTLTTEWTQYTIDLAGLDYNTVTLAGGVVEGFVWSALGTVPMRIYIDDIQWEANGPDGTCGTGP